MYISYFDQVIERYDEIFTYISALLARSIPLLYTALKDFCSSEQKKKKNPHI